MKKSNYAKAVMLQLTLLFYFGAAPLAGEVAELSVYLVLAEGQSTNGDNNVGLLGPGFTECSDCRVVDVRDSSGNVASVRAERQPRARIGADEIEAIELAEVRSILDPLDRYWIAVISPTGSAGEEIEKLSSEYPLDRVVVANGQFNAVSMLRGPDTRTVEVANFREKSELDAFAEQLSKQVGKRPEWIPFDEDKYRRDRKRFLEYAESDGGAH